MEHFGQKVKETRIVKGVTQKGLAEGICTQATISNLENGSSFPGLGTLLAIASRLDIDFSEIYEHTELNGNGYSEVFKQIKVLCGKEQYKKAHKILTTEIKFEHLGTNSEIKHYYYYLGITSLLAKNNFSDAFYNLNLALFIETGKHITSIDVLITTGIGLAYQLNSEESKAKTYFERGLNQLDSLKDQHQDSVEMITIYYRVAKFYRKIEEYKKALNLINLGIAIQKNEQVFFCLDTLIYEKGSSLAALGKKKEAEQQFFYAAAMAEFNQNIALVKLIKEQVGNYQLEGYRYW
ncbi:helix-turn-helix domain-containing protein [Carnobacterium maltaromaticum]|uniref:helix-turn-helix domain-containing protein n=1 Tax=Carnobacterium maltaromaticum TaxID=2751 RepID=UPI00191BC6D3|nr:helix-turn-helix transcriptional regulator [Carnobacterium maltaromaticum]CAD5901894.1 conserved hypothetical protein [Carnobacterium maltaromaticum]